MTTYSEITLTFNEEIPVNGRISFDLGNDLSFFTLFRELRQRANQATILLPTTNVGEASAIAFVNAFNLDYAPFGTRSYEVTRNVNSVTIKTSIPEKDFSNGVATNTINLDDYDVDFVYNNYAGTVFSITSIEYEQALSNPCENVRLKITTSDVATKVHSPVQIEGNTNNPYYVDIPRGGGLLPRIISVDLESSDGQLLSQTSEVPNILGVDNVNLTIINSPNGATVNIVVDKSVGLTLEYSIDNTTWQTANFFDSLGEGSYTIYVRDSFGCNVSKSFSVEAFGVTDPYTHISKSNSLRWAKRSVGGVDTDRRIDENRLSSEDRTEVVHQVAQRFLNTDIIVEQIRSNFETNTLTVHKPNGETILLQPQKITNNLRLKDRRDARKYNFGDSKMAVYFTTGKTYDYDTGSDLSVDYTLNGGLPEWAVIGNYAKVDTSWLEIKDIQFDESKQSEVIVFDSLYTGEDVLANVSSLYNREEYDVFEFVIDMSQFDGLEVYCVIEKSDTDFETIVYQSEYVKVESVLDDYLEIIYANDTNTDINYSNNISHKLRLRSERISDAPSGESENYSTDTTTILIEANLKESKEIVFEPIPRGLMVKLFRSLFHRKLYIDGVGYVVSEIPEVEGGLEESNLYELTAKLIKTDKYYNAKTFDTEVPSLGGIVEMPSLIKTGSSFIKIY